MKPYRPVALSAAKRPAVILFLILSLLAVTVEAQAQTSRRCPPSTTRPCTAAKIFNCTGSAVLVSFRLCCDGEQVISNYVVVPAVACPDAAGVYDFSPCTIIGVYDIISAGTLLEYEWDPGHCYLRIKGR